MAACVGASCLWLFPAVAHVSITSYGMPASAFVLAGYGVWWVLSGRWPDFAASFAIGFAAPIVFVAVPLMFSVPLQAALIVIPTLVAEAIRRGLRRRATHL